MAVEPVGSASTVRSADDARRSRLQIESTGSSRRTRRQTYESEFTLQPSLHTLRRA